MESRNYYSQGSISHIIQILPPIDRDQPKLEIKIRLEVRVKVFGIRVIKDIFGTITYARIFCFRKLILDG